MTAAAGFGWRHGAALAVAGAASSCGGGGGGGGGGGDAGTLPGTVAYAHSQVLGLAPAQALAYLPGIPPALPALQAPLDGGLLHAGLTMLTAEYVPAAISGARVACISGNGSSIGVLDAINPGVLSVSAAVLLGVEWVDADADADAAWAAAATRSESWVGWENCGVKPEGAAFKSSTVVPAADGSYVEDVVVGNPGTNFTTLRLLSSAAAAAEMRRSGHLTTEDPLRPLRITWRAFTDGAGHTLWIERGEPAPRAPAGTRGFITLFVPDRPR